MSYFLVISTGTRLLLRDTSIPLGHARADMSLLQLDDLNEPFSFRPNTFDVVHSRFVAGGINRYRWQGYTRDIKK